MLSLPRLYASASSAVFLKTSLPYAPIRSFASGNEMNEWQIPQEVVQPVVDSHRLQECSEKLTTEKGSLEGFPNSTSQNNHVGNNSFVPSKKGMQFLQSINEQNIKYSRGGQNGEGYIGVREAINLLSDSSSQYYTQNERKNLLRLSGEVQQRMRVKISKSYIEHALDVPKGAKYPHPILKVVMPESDEVTDLSGEIDPSNQNRYSPLPGLLHKYEMLLAFVSINCSSHCRYCYRLDLFNGISQKSKADMSLIANYIKAFNNFIDEAVKEFGEWDSDSGLWVHEVTKEPLLHIREILFSGGDPMTLPNSTLARYLMLNAEAGIKTIRLGTKELVFNPKRFDFAFWEVMDAFNRSYPEVRIEFVGHYVHPYELVKPQINGKGEYVYDLNLQYEVRKDIKPVLEAMNSRKEWIGHLNQFPIVAGVNDSPEILRLLMYQTNKLSITMHNIYACREIIGNQHFRGKNRIEAQYALVENAKIGLSGIENHGRLIMSTEYGKMEVMGVDENEVLLRVNRFTHGKKNKNTIVKVDLNKLKEGQSFYWLTDDIIKSAVGLEGQQVLGSLISEKNPSFIKEVKDNAAAAVYSPNLALLKDIPGASSSAEIQIILKDQSSKVIPVDFISHKRPTLATILSQHGYVEAACQEKLSCSTCVGKVQTNRAHLNPLPKPTEDELDVIDMILKNTSFQSENEIDQLRAGCNIPVKPGIQYTFTPLDRL